jgi:hypothetical protein
MDEANAATRLYTTLRPSRQEVLHAHPNCVAALLDERTLVRLVAHVSARTRLLLQ